MYFKLVICFFGNNLFLEFQEKLGILKKQIAFFDFDGTLIKGDSFFMFANFLVGKKKLYNILLKNIINIALCILGLKNNGIIKEKIFCELYKGIAYDDFKNTGVDFIDVLDKRINQLGLKLLNDFQKQEKEIVIVSASIKEWIEPWALKYGVKTVISTEINIDNKGNLTGSFSTLNCNEKEKVVRILEIYPDLKEYESYAIGDSDGDKDMFGIVDHHIKV